MELKGKTVDFLGDSITEGAGVSDIENNRYDNVIKREYGLKEVYNYGIGGTRIAHQKKPSEYPRHDLCFCGRAYNINPDADIVVVYGGVNDYLHGDADFGTMSDTKPDTFCGAVEFLMSFLKEKFEGKTVVFMTPAHCFINRVHDWEVSKNPAKGGSGEVLEKYVDVIKKKGAEKEIPVLDLYNNLGINANDESDKEAYTADGLHLNDKGHHVLAKKLAEFLLSL